MRRSQHFALMDVPTFHKERYQYELPVVFLITPPLTVCIFIFVCFELSLESTSEQQPEVKEFSLTNASEQRLDFEENTPVELAASNGADPTKYDREVDHLTTRRRQMLARNTAVGVAAQNNADPRKGNGRVDRDTGEGQRSEIEVVYNSTAADSSSGTPPLFGQEPIRGPAEHSNFFTTGSTPNGHLPSLSRRDPFTPTRGTSDAAPPHILANLRREYKAGLLDVARAWPGPLNEITLRSLIKMDDRRDDNRQFRIAEDKIHRDWEKYEKYARIGRFRNSSLPFPVYGHPYLRDLDILKLWVNLNQHIFQTWPPGYTPQYDDEEERDE